MRTVSRTFTCATVKAHFRKDKAFFTQDIDIPCPKSHINRLRGFIKKLLPEGAKLVGYDVISVRRIKCTMPISKFIIMSEQTIL